MTKKLVYSALEQTLLPWITMSGKLFGDIITHVFRENDLDLSREQMIVLKHLCDEDGRIQNDLAFITNRDKTSLTRLVSNMEKKGLLDRVQCQDDHRCNKIFITEKGKKGFKEAFPIVTDVANKIQENLTQEEIESTIKTLKKVFHNLSELHDEKK
jgi:DNA-binding MarR family transcriptional regulator